MVKKNKNRKKFENVVYTAFLLFITSTFFSKVLDFKYSELIKENIVEESLATNKSSLVKEVNGKLEYIGPDIRILEIEPADSFKLTDLVNTRVTTGTETVKRAVDNKEYKIEITHMTMAEFIGKTEQLNGKYDVIVIGRYVDDNLYFPNGKIEHNIYDSNKEKTWFRDYEALENDITNKKANEIMDFINSGQLIYIDSEISNSQRKDITKSIIYYHTVNDKGNFKNGNIESLDNLIKNETVNDTNGITINNILKNYIKRNNENKALLRSNIFSTEPEGDKELDSNKNADETEYELGDIFKRNMVFNISSNEKIDENVTIHLYLDINGDGLFKEEEIVKKVEGVNLSQGQYTLEYNMYGDYPDFMGYLSWRIEVVKDTLKGYTKPIKSYFDGNILFERLTEEKKIINVLQISPLSKFDLNNKYNAYYNEGKGTDFEYIFSMATDIGFQSLLKEVEAEGYKINIDMIGYTELYNKGIEDWMNSKYKDIFNYVNNVELNASKYDIIVIGFSTDYDVKQFSTKAIEQLEKYVKSGKGLILTHDTLDSKSQDNITDITQASEFVKVFRDTAGQSRYLDPNNKTSDYKEYTSVGINGNIIKHDRVETNSVGLTLLKLKMGNASNSTQIYNVNKSILTSYPFEIENEIDIKINNYQNFQLNLEDDNVVPIFNLTEKNLYANEQQNNLNPYINRYDSRNSYYTYSKDNITYSAIGQNKRNASSQYTSKEFQLFINTIVKTDRNSNHAPEISGLENIYKVPYEEDFNFSIIVKDIDQDKVKLNKILVNGQDITTENKISNEYQDSGVIYDLLIKKSLLDEDKDVTITLEAEDQKGAKSIKEYKIKPMKNVLSSSSIIVNSIVNIEKDFSINLKANDINNIEILEVNYPSNSNGIYSLKNTEYSIVSEGLKIKGTITSFFKYSGKKIPISIKYRIKGKEEDMYAEANIISNSDYASNNGKVNINVEDKDGSNIDKNINLTLLNNNTYSKEIELNNGESKISNLELGEYKLSIKKLSGYKVEEVNINGEKFDFVEGNTIDFILDSQNNTKEIEIIVSKQQNKISNLRHGLYERIDNNGYTSIIEDNNFEIALESTVSFASDFNVTGEDPKVNLTIDSNLNISNTYLKIYELNGEKLEKISEKNLEIEKSNNEYKIMIKGKFNQGKILILYSARLPKEGNYEYFTNKINVNDGDDKLVTVKPKKGDDEPSLPDLF